MVLPADLRTAEAEALAALQQALSAEPTGRWTVELRFEGLKVQPLAQRLLAALGENGDPRLLFADAGATALAQRDRPELAPRQASLGDQKRLQQSQEAPTGGLLILVAPAQADYEQVEAICSAHGGPIVLLNGSLEEAAIGIGAVARERRKGFLSNWQSAYSLIPLDGGALKRAFPQPWFLYRRDADGHRFVAEFELRPDSEQQAEALADGAAPGVGRSLQAMDRFLEGLRS